MQRSVLERLTGLIMTPIGEAVPAGIVSLEAMRLIVELLGEVSSEEVQQMKHPGLTKLTSHTRQIRAQVSARQPCELSCRVISSTLLVHHMHIDHLLCRTCLINSTPEFTQSASRALACVL